MTMRKYRFVYRDGATRLWSVDVDRSGVPRPIWDVPIYPEPMATFRPNGEPHQIQGPRHRRFHRECLGAEGGPPVFLYVEQGMRILDALRALVEP